MKKRHTEGEVWADGNFVMAGDYATEGEPDMLVEVQIAEFPGADAARFAAAWNACGGIPTEALTPGSLKALIEALTMARQHFPTETGHLAVCGRCRECGEATPYSHIVLCRACAGKAIDAALAPFKGTQEVKPDAESPA